MPSEWPLVKMAGGKFKRGCSSCTKCVSGILVKKRIQWHSGVIFQLWLQRRCPLNYYRVSKGCALSPFLTPDRHDSQEYYRLLCFSQTNTQVCVPVDNTRPPYGGSCSVHHAETRACKRHWTHICQRINTYKCACIFFFFPHIHRACTQFPHSLHFAHREVSVWAGPGRVLLIQGGDLSV